MPSSDPVHIRGVDGLGPVKAELVSTQSGSGRGEIPQGSSVGKRNIVLTLGLNPDWEEYTISSLRQLLYRYFLPTQWCKLRFFTDDIGVVDIEGDVESFEPNLFAQDPEMQISIICYKPDFVSADATIINGVVDNGTIESVFDYIGSVGTGFELRVESATANPDYTGKFTITVKAPLTPQIFEVTPVTVNVLKYFKLSTVRNAKRVQTISVADGSITNLLGGMTTLSVWPEIKPGENAFSIAATENGQDWTLAYFNRFAGV